MSVLVDQKDKVRIVSINRPERRNAVDSETAKLLEQAFSAFEEDEDAHVAILTGNGGYFCSGADLKAFIEDGTKHLSETVRGPMGPTRMRLSKPVIAAIEGPAVAGGLELALWCDLRVAASDAVFGVYNRRFGIPLVDLGTIRLPRLIGHSHAMDLILTGRGVSGDEAVRMGLVNRLVEPGNALKVAIELAQEIAALPQACLRSDRISAYEQWDLAEIEAMRNEAHRGISVLDAIDRKALDAFLKGKIKHQKHGK
jgi:enoyl-CoA hydratase